MNLKKDIVLLLLYVPGLTGRKLEPISGRTRFMKGIFLFNKELAPKFKKGREPKVEEMYEYFPWSYGPFSKGVYADIDFFLNLRFIKAMPADSQGTAEETAEEIENWSNQTGIENSTLDNPALEFVEEEFSLDVLGVQFVEDILLKGEVTDDQLALLSKFKERLNGTPLRAILEYVYRTYPEFTSKSEIVDKVLNHS